MDVFAQQRKKGHSSTLHNTVDRVQTAFEWGPRKLIRRTSKKLHSCLAYLKKTTAHHALQPTVNSTAAGH